MESINVLRSAMYSVLSQRNKLLKALWVPFFAYITLSYGEYWLLTKLLYINVFDDSGALINEGHLATSSYMITSYVLAIPSTLISVFIAIKIHKVILLSDNIEHEKVVFSEFVDFCKLSLILFFVGLFFLSPFFVSFGIYSDQSINSSPQILFLSSCLFIIFGLFLVSQLMLVLPATAVGHKMTLSESWGLTRRHRWLMPIVTILVPLFFSLPYTIISSLELSTLVDAVIRWTFYMIILVYEIACISSAYRYFLHRPSHHLKA